MPLSRRSFLKTLAVGATGLLVPADVAAEPARRVWALDRTMLGRSSPDYWFAPIETRSPEAIFMGPNPALSKIEYSFRSLQRYDYCEVADDIILWVPFTAHEITEGR